MWLSRKGWTKTRIFPAVGSAIKAQSARLEALPKNLKSTNKVHEDLLDQFIRAKEQHPECISDKEILMLGISMVLAGSDTTAWTLSAFFFYVLRTPKVYPKLVSELLDIIRNDDLNGINDGNIIPYTELQKMPYLDACVKECFRMHPAARFSSERVVPSPGAMICGKYVPGGTVVAINAWVIHRRTEIWGEDVDIFRPERWLEDEERSKKMAGMLFQFGAGDFICLGRNISLLEMYKIIAAAIMKFDWELVEPEKEWTLLGGSFVRPKAVNVRVKSRSITKSV
jgi:cytochrome P450